MGEYDNKKRNVYGKRFIKTRGRKRRKKTKIELFFGVIYSFICCKNCKESKRESHDVYKTKASEMIRNEMDTSRDGGIKAKMSIEREVPEVSKRHDEEAVEKKIFSKKKLLNKKLDTDKDKICAIIDLDETLVHSSFKAVENPDMIISVEVDGVVHPVYVLQRPFALTFIKKMGQLFECILFTASLAKYADPVADLLDKNCVFKERLFRESCVQNNGNFIKDLNDLGRNLSKVIIIDNSPISYLHHPENAVSVSSWFDDPNDQELLNLIPIMEQLAKADDVRKFIKLNKLNQRNSTDSINHKTFTNDIN